MKDWWIKFVAIVAVVFLFAWFLWPTPWVYNQTGEKRWNRFTGDSQVRLGDLWESESLLKKVSEE